MSTNHNRIKVADLETNESNKQDVSNQVSVTLPTVAQDQSLK
ncbi:hypothetical protein N4T20_10290 [Flavobacterium sp. TR2]|nr:hypothetical protein [Flavobacterium sp. TR2]UWY30304.1 hypothetical protein N4T20_10290 [Flavobacterium sp. TR2]